MIGGSVKIIEIILSAVAALLILDFMELAATLSPANTLISSVGS
jgi:hypothetical protein